MEPSGGKRSGPWHVVPQKTVGARPRATMGITDPLAPCLPYDLPVLTEIRQIRLTPRSKFPPNCIQ